MVNFGEIAQEARSITLLTHSQLHCKRRDWFHDIGCWMILHHLWTPQLICVQTLSRCSSTCQTTTGCAPTSEGGPRSPQGCQPTSSSASCARESRKLRCRTGFGMLPSALIHLPHPTAPGNSHSSQVHPTAWGVSDSQGARQVAGRLPELPKLPESIIIPPSASCSFRYLLQLPSISHSSR